MWEVVRRELARLEWDVEPPLTLDLMADWTQMLAVTAFLTMTVGNVTALLQGNLKRMLAYSSIGHAGYILMGIMVASTCGAESLLILNTLKLNHVIY